MKFVKNAPIPMKLTLLVLAAVAVALLLSCFAFVVNDVIFMRDATVRQLTALADVLGSNSAAAITFDDSNAAQQVLESLTTKPSIEMACIYDTNGQVFAKYSANPTSHSCPKVPARAGHYFTANGRLDVAADIVVAGDRIGMIHLHATLGQVHQQLLRYAAIVAGVMVASFGASYLLASRLQRGISDPILALANTAQKISAWEDYSIRVEKTSDDELGVLYDQFNRMLEQVESSKRALQEAHRKLELQSQEKMRAIVETAADAIVTFSSDGIIESCNTASCEMFGYTRDELVGSPFDNLLADPKGPSWRDYFAERPDEAGSRGRHANEINARCKDGTVTPTSISLSRVATDDGWLATAILRDMTDFKHLQRELNQAQRLESIGQLAAGIAHEINTPMQFVGDNIEYLEDCTGRLFAVVDAYQHNLHGDGTPRSWDERCREIDEVIKQNQFDRLREQIPEAITESLDGIQRVKNIVRAMKEFSHPGGGERAPSDLNQAIDSTVTITRNRWKYVADLELELDPDMPSVWCRQAEINQVLLNLIINAADAITDKEGESGESMGRIFVRSRAIDGNAVIEVEDTGCGIPEEIRSRIFDPFFTTKEVGEGTGQGLAICYNIIVNKHQGTLHVESTPGVGTLFRLTIPWKLDPAAEPCTGSPPELATVSSDYA